MRNMGFVRGRAVPSSAALVATAAAAILAAGHVLAAGQATTQAPPRPAPAQAEAPAANLPSARSVLDKHIEAVGGRKAILGHSSTHASGTMSVPGSGMSGTFDIYAAKPNRTMLRITIGGIGEIVDGFDGTYGWSISALQGASLTQGKELEQKRFDADYYSELHDASRYQSMKTVEKTTFEGRPCYKVSLVKKDGGEDFEYYDAETGLKAGMTGTRETPMGTLTATQMQSDYKKFGDLLMPTTLKQRAMGVEQVFSITSIEYDKVDPSTFQMPAEIRALIK
jgi:hypothetical protein